MFIFGCQFLNTVNSYSLSLESEHVRFLLNTGQKSHSVYSTQVFMRLCFFVFVFNRTSQRLSIVATKDCIFLFGAIVYCIVTFFLRLNLRHAKEVVGDGGDIFFLFWLLLRTTGI